MKPLRAIVLVAVCLFGLTVFASADTVTGTNGTLTWDATATVMKAFPRAAVGRLSRARPSIRLR